MAPSVGLDSDLGDPVESHSVGSHGCFHGAPVAAHGDRLYQGFVSWMIATIATIPNAKLPLLHDTPYLPDSSVQSSTIKYKTVKYRQNPTAFAAACHTVIARNLSQPVIVSAESFPSHAARFLRTVRRRGAPKSESGLRCFAAVFGVHTNTPVDPL
jgi:hypothetical protein